MTVRIAERAIPFVGRIELEERQCGPNNQNLFTLSALKNANKYLLEEVTDENLTEKYDTALKYWNSIGTVFHEWMESPGNDIRERYIYGYGVILSALGLIGRHLIEKKPEDYEKFLPRLKGINWSKWQTLDDGSIKTTEDGKKIPSPFWNGFAMSGSVVQNTTTNIRHTAMLLRKTLGLELTEEEEYELSSLRTGSS